MNQKLGKQHNDCARPLWFLLLLHFFAVLKMIKLCLGPVQTYLNIFESSTFLFRKRLPSTHIRRVRQRIQIFLNPLSALRVEKNESETNPITCGRINADIFEFDDVARSCPVSYRTINQYGGTTCKPSFSKANPDTIGCVWTGEFDLNTLRVDGEFF